MPSVRARRTAAWNVRELEKSHRARSSWPRARSSRQADLGLEDPGASRVPEYAYPRQRPSAGRQAVTRRRPRAGTCRGRRSARGDRPTLYDRSAATASMPNSSGAMRRPPPPAAGTPEMPAKDTRQRRLAPARAGRSVTKRSARWLRARAQASHPLGSRCHQGRVGSSWLGWGVDEVGRGAGIKKPVAAAGCNGTGGSGRGRYREADREAIKTSSSSCSFVPLLRCKRVPRPVPRCLPRLGNGPI